VLAGDFNTWFGTAEPAYLETRAAFPDTHMPDTRATFLGILRLDHVFLRLDQRWRASFRRGDNRFGSDHYPLIGTVRFR
jgi:endonuclease/exonuclease/phosphatase (EEP) superfamily protein YafD